MRTSSRSLLAVVVTILLVATSCSDASSSGSGTSITFNVDVAKSELPAIEELLRRFQQTTGSKVSLSLFARGRNRPGPRIELSTLKAEELTKELGNPRPGVHLFAVDNGNLGPLLKGDLVQELPAEVAEDLAKMPEPQVPRMGDGTCKEFFMPFRPNVRLTYVRKEALAAAGIEQPPRTVGELEETATRLRDQKPPFPVVTLSLAPGDPTAVTVAEWIFSYGGDPLDLDAPKSVQAFERLRRLWQQGVISPESFGARWDTEPDYLLSKHAHLAQNWTFTSAILADAGVLDEFTVYEGWRGPEREAHVVGGDVLGIPRNLNGRQRETAIALARFLMSREAQTYLVRKNAWPAIRADAYGSLPPSQEETVGAIRKALAAGYFRPRVDYWDLVVRQMTAAVRRVLLDGEDPAVVLRELQAEVDVRRGTSAAETCPSGT